MSLLTSYLQGLVAVCALLWSIGLATNAVASSTLKEEYTEKLRRTQFDAWLREWPQSIVNLFDQVFGKRAWSLQFWIRSCIASFGFVVVITVAYVFIFPGYGWDRYRGEWQPLANYYGTLYVAILVVLGSNFLADYLSLFETRWVIRRIVSTASLAKIGVWMLGDLIATALLFHLVRVALFFSVQSYLVGFSTIFEDLAFLERSLVSEFVVLNTILPGRPGANMAPDQFAYYSTFGTSLWVWVIVGSTALVMFLQKYTRLPWEWMKTRLNIADKPFTVLGYIASVACVIVSATAFAVYVVVKAIWL